MNSPVLGEFLGTLILVLLGNGVVAAVLLKRSKAEGSGWMVITAGWAFAVMAGVFTAIACGSSDAHLNPAVTIGFAMRDGNFAKLAPYLAAQMLGAMLGAVLVWLHYYPHWKETPETNVKLGCFCTAPAIRNTVTNLVSEIIARTDRLRHQSRTRSRTAHRAHDSPDCREGRLGLGVCADSHYWSTHRRCARRCASPRACNFLTGAECQQISAGYWQQFRAE